LIYLGSSSETKYTNAVEWNKQRKLIWKIGIYGEIRKGNWNGTKSER
jgi:hypothetical protein